MPQATTGMTICSAFRLSMKPKASVLLPASPPSGVAAMPNGRCSSPGPKITDGCMIVQGGPASSVSSALASMRRPRCASSAQRCTKLAAALARRDGCQPILDAALTPEWVAASVPGLLTDADRLARMGAAATGVIPLDADEKLARIVLDAAGAAS